MNQYIFVGDKEGGKLVLLGFFVGDDPYSAYSEMLKYDPSDYVGEVGWYKIGEHDSWWQFEKRKEGEA